MKKNFTFFTVALLATFLGIQSPIYGQLQWEKYIIDNTLVKPEVVAIGDLNGDTKPDVIVNDLTENKVILYINNFPMIWEKKIIDANLGGAYVTDIGDLDGDGDLDIVASGYSEKVVVWYENNHPAWNRHTIAENLTVSGAVSLADIDGDDNLDVVSSGYREGGDLVWYENNHPTWTPHMIRSNYPTEWSWVGDIDGDDAVDVAVCRWHEGEVNWFRNENAGLTWTEFIIDDSLKQASLLYIGDIDGDDDMDITAAGVSDDVIVWYENNYPDWNRHTIDNNLERAWCVVVADIDGDGKQDVAATGRDPDKVVWYKNNHPAWEKQIIDANLSGANLLLSADIDNDNALDIVVPGVSAGNLVWYRNPTNMAYAKSVTSNFDSSYIQPSGDTVFVKAQLVNPEQHPAIVHAQFRSETVSNQDSIQLFDDGLHDDGEASDNLWGAGEWLTGLEEDMFTVDLSINDLTTGTNYLHPNVTQFTTAGPLNVDSSAINAISNFRYTIKPFIRNHGVNTEVKNITIKLICDDPWVTNIYPEGVRGCANLLPGQIEGILQPFAVSYDSASFRGSFNFVFEISSGGIFYWTETSLIVTAIEKIEVKPTTFALSQNYPNPFNPSTTIKYSIPKLSNVQLKVFDVLGNEIAVLVNEEKSVGNYEVEFDASNWASGVYFYELKAGDFIEIKKMVLIK